MAESILQASPLPQSLVVRLRQHFPLVDMRELAPLALASLADEFTVLLVDGETAVSAAQITALPQLKLIAVFGVGYERVDVLAARAKGVRVTHTPGVLTDDVADLAIGLLLATARQIGGAQRFIERGGWLQGSYPWTRKVSGARLGILGLGRIGRAIAQRAAAFNMAVSYHSRQQAADFTGRFFATPLALADHCDFLLVCTNGGAQTRALVDARVLAALGCDGILINIARGSVVDEAALVTAIDRGTIAGAGLDVFECEPQVPAALMGRDNVVLTPHMASATHCTRRLMVDLVFDNIAAHFAGRPLPTPVVESPNA
ncbi:2-hydroxyacid dehydrogenase [Serratia proteamaculans]|uniref:2-hydroxyacid dehydrogenase n=1 Tax=Serratia proteamaculans TaxID=28151 RepID=UPI00217BC0C7|nr:2-hydroxyacid dehydrogenase [Serratia proteamaculans]CAI2019892.1 Glyoxylate/hydroxypyruvate reductase B [Serratia proteamaculans]